MRGTHRHLNMPSQLAQGVAGAWDFNIGTGLYVPDVSGNGNTGVWQGTLGSQWGGRSGPGHGGLFNGTDNYVVAPLARIPPQSPWSISTWLKPSSLGSSAPIVVYVGNDDAGYGWGINNGSGTNGTIVAGLFGAVRWISTTLSPLSTSSFSHIIMTYTSPKTTFYWNGVVLGAIPTGAGPGAISVSKLTIGAELDLASHGFPPIRFFAGTIGQTVFWPGRALTPNDVAALYNLGQGKAYPFTA